jgi:hypothetical protein
MSRGFSKLDPQNHKGKTDSWMTPLSIINALGEFDLDPCAFPGHNTAKTLYTSNGDTSLWFGRVWLNPPYSDVWKWLDMLAVHGRGIALVFARTDTRWAQEHFKKAHSVFFLQGRIKFLDENLQQSTNAGHGNMFLSYGETPDWPFEGWKAK